MEFLLIEELVSQNGSAEFSICLGIADRRKTRTERTPEHNNGQS